MSRNVTIDAVYDVEYMEMGITAGIVVGSVFAGALIVLGIICFLLLSSENGGSPRQRTLLRTYVVILLPLIIGLQLTYFFVANFLGFFHPSSSTEMTNDLMIKLRFPADLLPVIVAAMTDGLFVSHISNEKSEVHCLNQHIKIWRCYMVQRSLKQGSIQWQHIFWILPACIWVLTLGMINSYPFSIWDNRILNHKYKHSCRNHLYCARQWRRD